MHALVAHNKKANEGYATLKLDMSKTYNRRRCEFLFDVMHKKRFPPGICCARPNNNLGDQSKFATYTREDR